jgi:transcriptional regulator with XRE-family HTH domain
MELGKQIKKYRIEKGLSQEELAEKIFVSRQSISNWETNKNYPDVKSLLLLSYIFDVSLDILIKGDLEEMKEKIQTEDIERFKREANILTILMIVMVIFPIPLFKFWGYIGVGVWAIIAIVTMYWSIRVEKFKKHFNIQTYKEIVAFMEGKTIDEIEKNREYGKHPYQKLLLAVGAALITLVIAVILTYFLNR